MNVNRFPRFLKIALLGCALIGGGGVYVAAVAGADRTLAAAPHATPPADAASVNTVHPKRSNMAHKFDTNATLEAFETADLYPKVSGYLSQVGVDIGDHVRSGQVLAIIELPEVEKELAEAQAQLAAKRADAALQQVTFERQDMLFRNRGTTEQAYDEAKSRTAVAAAQVDVAAATVEKIRTMLGYTRIIAPFDGVVARRDVNRGDFVQAATGGRNSLLFTVQRIDVIRVYCDVPESDIARVKVGLPATVKPYGLQGKPFEGKVTRFARRLDPATRNMRTEIDLPNPNEVLLPGMYAQVSLETITHSNVLTLPNSAIASDANGKYVYEVNQGHIVRQPVQTGLAESGMTEIVGGISENADVVAAAQTAPPPGTTVRPSIRAAL